MSALLYLASVVLALFAFGVFGSAKTIVHEIFAALLALAALIAFCTASLLAALARLHRITRQADANAWAIGLAVWRELRFPGKDTSEPVRPSNPGEN